MKISFVIPKRNNAEYFENAILSVCNQKLKPFEIIISENYSTDGSYESTIELGKRLHIKVVIPDKPLSYGENVAFALSNVSKEAEYICIGASDDIWHPNFLNKLVKKISKNKKNITLIYSDYYLINEQDDEFGATGTFRKPLIISGENAFKFYLSGCSYIITGALFNASFLLKTDTIELIKNTANSADWMLLLEAARSGTVIYYPYPLFYRRVHCESVTYSQNSVQLDGGHSNALFYYSIFLKEKNFYDFSKMVNDRINLTSNIKRIDSIGYINKYKSIQRKIQYYLVKTRIFFLFRQFV